MKWVWNWVTTKNLVPYFPVDLQIINSCRPKSTRQKRLSTLIKSTLTRPPFNMHNYLKKYFQLTQKKILEEKCLFIFLIAISFHLFVSILCAKILCVNWALEEMGQLSKSICDVINSKPFDFFQSRIFALSSYREDRCLQVRLYRLLLPRL